ncbi:MAG TPA: hypothetical protein VFE47_14675 [Tepidisphaeraceae bacterium]|jgi:hypothetical protein|nr:hypothetical protein [Tepidisphaeraceae bacterium]
MPQRFDSIWYLPAENTWADFQILAYRDIGSLTIDGASISFAGPKGTVQIPQIADVRYGKQGRDFINNWVWVKPVDGDYIFFADGGWRGWRGIFGGTRKLFRAVSAVPRSGAG